MRFAVLPLCKAVLFGTEMLREVVRILNTKLSHHLLLFGGSRFPCRKRHLQYGWRLWRYWRPLVKFLSKEVSLVSQQDLRTFNLPKIKSLCCDFFWRSHHRVDVRTHEITEILCCADDIGKGTLLFRLERET